MTNKNHIDYSIFRPFEIQPSKDDLNTLILIQDIENPHPLCLEAVELLQGHLKMQTDWKHNFGLDSNIDTDIIGKMFGVLMVENSKTEIGYLSAFSGKLAGSNHHPGFVPPIYDTLEPGGFLNTGMQHLSSLSEEIKLLEDADLVNTDKLKSLKEERKSYSFALQQQLFQQYNFLNSKGEQMSLINLFINAGYRQPPAGAGECAGPKLLQYAFQHEMKPLALVEFWWGLSPKSANWKHQHLYMPCKEKCAPIFTHMLR